MHLFVNNMADPDISVQNMADPDISDYEFDDDDLFRRKLYCIWKFHGINWRFDGRKSSLLSILMQ
jgi:catabolite regulation protein CreA